MKPKRVLHVIDGMGSGGAEAMIMNLYRNLDRNHVQFDFLVRIPDNLHEKEITDLGGQLHVTPAFPQKAISNYQETKNFFKNHNDYDIVHAHGNALLYTAALNLARKAGVDCRIMHSHNTQTRKPIYRSLHEFNKRFLDTLATERFACSHAAGEWMFDDRQYQVINNAIDVEKYLYNGSHREEVRKELHLEDQFVIGHIGRFLTSKNHPFILEVFAEIHRQHKQAVLLLLGTGPLEEQIKKQVQEMGLEEAVRFAGVRSDVHKVLQAMDVFLFPSLFEGLPVTLVEAQTSGIKCFVSDNITAEVCLTDLVKVKSLQDPAAEWAKEILEYSSGYTRQNMHQEITAAGYNIEQVAKLVEAFYLNQGS